MRLAALVVLAGVATLWSGACADFKGTSAGSGSDAGGDAASSGSGSSSGGSGSSSGGTASSSGGSSGGASGGGSGSGSGSGGGSGSSSGGSSGGGSGSGSGSSGGGDGGVAYGPGPEGDLPSGYCCTSNEDCRNRYCVDLGGGNKMCEDECDGSQSNCNNLQHGFPFTCTWDDAMAYGFCEPNSPSMACVPASQYRHGTQADGTCCSQTGDSVSGNQCLAGNCGGWGTSGPFICNLACDSTHLCPGTATCQNIGIYSLCMPLDMNYTCQP